MKLEDIAKIAGVSKGTVSLALNDKPGVSEKTRQNIMKIAQENNYIPHRKNKKTKKLKFLSIVVMDGIIISEDYFKLPFFNELLGSLSSQAALSNYDYSTVTVDYDILSETLLDYSKNFDIDGIILLGTNLKTKDLLLANNLIKNLVIIDTTAPEVNANIVAINNFLGAYEATKYLIDNGHSEIGYIMGENSIKNFEERFRGFKTAIEDFQDSSTNMPIFKMTPMDSNIITNQSIENRLLRFSKNVTAVFCENDYMAISAIKTLKKNDINIPDDISIIGFDGIDESSLVKPQLNTLKVPQFELARNALSLLAENVIDQTIPKKHILVNTNLQIRESVKIINK